VIYNIAEYYGSTKTANEGLGLSSDEMFKRMKLFEETCSQLKNARNIIRIADPAIFGKESSGYSIAESAWKKGIQFRRAKNERVNGLAQVQNRLVFDEKCECKLYFFENCRNMIRTLPLLQYDDKKVEDVDSSGEDHAYDCLRYICNENPIKTTNVKTTAWSVPELGI
jgi:hypothetical protein